MNLANEHTFYYTLISSLPHLPHFEQATRLPINRVRLDQRLLMLQAEDGEQLHRAETLLEWHYQSLSLSDEIVLDHYRDCMQGITNSTLCHFIKFSLAMRMVMAALRSKHQDNSVEMRNSLAKIDPRMNSMVRHWDEPAMQLNHQFPWVEAALTLMQQGESVHLECLLMNVIWRYLTQITEHFLFSFEGVFAYVFKWEIISRCLSYSAEIAPQRFYALREEIVNDACKQYAQY